MKKIMAAALVLFAFAAFSFVAGCKKAEEPKAPEPTKEAAPAPAPAK
jgi:nitrous oxide reductase accessory protein NosL